NLTTSLLTPTLFHYTTLFRSSDQKRPDGPPRYRVNRSLLARNPTRTHNNAGNKNQAIARNKLPEAEAARDQLMLALRVASAKLRSEEHTSELQSPDHIVCRLL